MGTDAVTEGGGGAVTSSGERYLAAAAGAELGSPRRRPEHGSRSDAGAADPLQLLQPAARLRLLAAPLAAGLDDIIGLADRQLVVNLIINV